MRTLQLRALATVGVAAFALAACGSSSKASSPTTTAAPATTVAPDTTVAPATTTAPATGGTATVTLATTSLGKVLVDAKGMTLYRFDADTTPGTSTCTAAPCSSTWPAATATGTPVAGAGITASKLSSFTRADGTRQLEMDGHPLYTFAGDSAPGDVKGEGILSKWWAVGPDGSKVAKP